MADTDLIECSCLEVFGEDPDCPLHGIDALEARLAEQDARIAELEAELEASRFAERNGKSLAEDGIHAIRELLKVHDVPVAAFIDDHVGNAIAQRDEARAALTAAIGAGGQAVAWVRPEVLAKLQDGRAANNVDLSKVKGGNFTEPLYTHPAPSGQAVAVKPLEWVEHETNWWSADPKGLGFGYEVRFTDRGTTRIRMPAQHWDIFEGTVAEAKATAQADYERRILSVIAHPVQPVWRGMARLIVEDVSNIQYPTRLSSRTVERLVFDARKEIHGDGNCAAPQPKGE